MTQRQFQRVKYHLPASVNLTQGAGQFTSYIASIEDLSISGAGLLVAEPSFGPLVPGAKSLLTITRGKSGDPIRIVGTVVSVTLEEDGSHRVGIRFDRVRYEAVASIDKHESVMVELSPYGFTSGAVSSR